MRDCGSLVSCALCVLVFTSTAEAATRTVCASGCAYTNLQAAINAAVAGDTILVRAGQVFTGHYTLKAKGSSTSYITIKSDAASGLPPDGVRLVPGVTAQLSSLPRLVGKGGTYKTTPIFRAEPGAHHYRLQFLNIDGTAQAGYETLVEIGDDRSTARPHHIVLDRVYIHGHRYKGQKRGISLNGANITIKNSYIADIKSTGFESQALGGWNGPGPFSIVNNYVEGAGENIMFGGAGPSITNLVPSDIEIRNNHIKKPTAWMNPILREPGSPAASPTTGGSLLAGTHYFKVVAVMRSAAQTVLSLPSAEVRATVSGAGAVLLAWKGVSGADNYRIYRGTSAGGENRYLQTSGNSTAFSYTGSGEASGTPPRTPGKWLVKNLLELKNARRVTVEGNVIENNWAGGQHGYAIVLTPRNSDNNAPWSRVQDVTFVRNIIRHSSGWVAISGYDDSHVSQQAKNIAFRNNLVYDINSSTWRGSAKPILLVHGPASITFNHNTLVHTASSIVAVDGPSIYGFVYTNNIHRHGKYGIMGAGTQLGNPTLKKYFPGSNVTYNVFANGPASSYPSPNSFPTLAQWDASFADAAADDFRVLSTSVFYKAGSGGSVPGANVSAISEAVAGTLEGSMTLSFSTLSRAAGEADAVTATGEAEGDTRNRPPVAEAGGTYSGTAGSPLVVNGSASSDPDGAIVVHRWWWNDDIVIRASQIPDAAVHGSRWMKASLNGAADGVALHNPNKGEPKRSTATASPTDYVELQFNAAAGVKYHLWFRMRADGDSSGNDSFFIQFSNSLNSSGAPAWRIGTTSALDVILEEGRGAGVAGWGWNDQSWGALAAPVVFATSGPQKLRIQQREDGAAIDQIVISSDRYRTARPGSLTEDATLVSVTLGSTSGAAVTHTYKQPGSYPVSLVVTDDKGASVTDGTVIAIGRQ